MRSISWGIVGTGQASLQFAQGLSLLPDANIRSVASREYSNAQSFASCFNGARSCRTYDELLDDSEVDIVYIGTPHPLHYQQCLQALDSGKHVLCEKPFTMTAAEAEEVTEKARECNLFCMEAMWMRFTPCVRMAVQKIREGAIGSIRMFSAHLGHPIAASSDHRLLNPLLGGGVLMDLGVYPLSLAQQLVGSPQDFERLFVEGDTGVEEQAALLLRYHSNCLASISCSFRTNMSNDCLIMGTAGSLRIHAPLYRPIQFSITSHDSMNVDEKQTFCSLPWSKRVPLFSKAVTFFRETIAPALRGKVRHSFQIYEGNGYHYQAAEAMRCLRKGLIESEVMPHRETIEVMRVMDALRAQKKAGQR